VTGGRVENIGARGAARRRRQGLVLSIAGIVAAAALIALDEPRWWRLLLVVPFGLAANGFLQARDRT
jgi:hypothetical protein